MTINKNILHLFGVLFLAFTPTFFFSQILLNEFMIDPDNDNTGEFIEIYNAGDSLIDLSVYYICDAQDTDKIIPFPDSCLHPGDYGLLLDPDYAGEYDFLIPDSTPCFSIPDSRFGMYGISNSTRKPFSILNNKHEIMDSYLTGTPDWPTDSHSIERIRFQDTLWSVSSDPYGTPGFKNSSAPKDHDLSISDLYYDIVDNNLHMSFIINNTGLQSIHHYSFGYIVDVSSQLCDLNDTMIFDNDLTLLPDSSVQYERSLELYFKGSFTLTAFVIYSTTIQDTIQCNGYIPLLDDEMIITEFVALPSDNFSCEYIELFSRSRLPLQLKDMEIHDMTGFTTITSDYVLRPDSMVVLAQSASFYDDFPSVPNVIIPPAWRNLNNSEDDIRLQNPTGSTICNLHYNAVWDMLSDCAMQLVDTALNYQNPGNWETSVSGSPGKPNKTKKQLFHLTCFGNSAFFTPLDTLKFYIVNDGYFPLPEQSAIFTSPLAEEIIRIPQNNPGDTLICFPCALDVFREGTQICTLSCSPYFSHTIKYYHPYTQSPCFFNEILFDPLDTYGQIEFIELECPARNLDLDHWQLKINNTTITLNSYLSNIYNVLYDGDKSLSGFSGSNTYSYQNFPSLPNGGADCYLFDPVGNMVDHGDLRDHNELHSGKSLEKQFTSMASEDPAIWFSSVAATAMTPGRQNSITALPGSRNDLDIYPEIFSPGIDERIQFSIDTEFSLSHCELMCFNMAGQLIHKKEHSLFSHPSCLLFWNGKMNNGDYPSRGLYLALAVLHKTNGDSFQLRETFAIK